MGRGGGEGTGGTPMASGATFAASAYSANAAEAAALQPLPDVPAAEAMLLVLRTLDADVSERERLLRLAGDAGLGDGTWFARTPAYFRAVAEWARAAAGDPERRTRVLAHLAALIPEMERVPDAGRKMALAREVLVATFAMEGTFDEAIRVALAPMPSPETHVSIEAATTAPDAAAAAAPSSAKGAGMLSGLLDFSGPETSAEAFDMSGKGLLQGGGAMPLAPSIGTTGITSSGISPMLPVMPSLQPALAMRR